MTFDIFCLGVRAHVSALSVSQFFTEAPFDRMERHVSVIQGCYFQLLVCVGSDWT